MAWCIQSFDNQVISSEKLDKSITQSIQYIEKRLELKNICAFFVINTSYMSNTLTEMQFNVVGMVDDKERLLGRLYWL